ncbi:MAG TPA: WYL domain-containing transcriptional regulator [Candidatus Aminicenantes bacterium]|nr:WYL domain-containing transcriptional regulator [Candidatus Aminicenantes bacterium]
MSKRLAFERYLWVHNRLKRGGYLSLAAFMEAFEISRRQAARDIEFMRDFFRAPIEYSALDRGYAYADDSFELPGMWISEEEIVALLVTKRLATVIPDETTRTRVFCFFDQVNARTGLDLHELEDRISLKNIQVHRVRTGIFSTVVYAMGRRRKLRLLYRSPWGGKETERMVAPLHLLLYMGNWHLLGYCEVRRGVRDFVLSRIISIELTDERVSDEQWEIPIADQLERNYGIFFDGPPVRVRLRFRPRAAALVRDQVWYPGQQVEEHPDGSVDLSFPVADFREITGDVLRFGAEVEVIAPEELRRQVAETAAAVTARYRD